MKGQGFLDCSLPVFSCGQSLISPHLNLFLVLVFVVACHIHSAMFGCCTQFPSSTHQSPILFTAPELQFQILAYHIISSSKIDNESYLSGIMMMSVNVNLGMTKTKG
jgi:hypothetical protein